MACVCESTTHPRQRACGYPYFLTFSSPAALRAKDIRIGVPSKSLVFLPLYVGVAQHHFQSEGHNPRGHVGGYPPFFTMLVTFVATADPCACWFRFRGAKMVRVLSGRAEGVNEALNDADPRLGCM